MLNGQDIFIASADWGVRLPKINLLLLLSIAIVMYLLFYAPDFTPKKIWNMKKKEKEDEEERGDAWRISWVHFFLGGVAVPKLISFFGSLGFIQIIAYVFVKSNQAESPDMVSWFNSHFLDRSGLGAQIFQMIFFYVGLWVGVPFSLDTIRRIYHVQSGRTIIIRSFILLAGFSILSGFYALTEHREDFFLSNDFNFFDLLVRCSLFLVLTKWYMYRIVIRRPRPAIIEA